MGTRSNQFVQKLHRLAADEKEKQPESFDGLAARLNERFARLAADVEQMRKQLREAEKESERLRHLSLGSSQAGQVDKCYHK